MSVHRPEAKHGSSHPFRSTDCNKLDRLIGGQGVTPPFAAEVAVPMPIVA